MIGGPRIVHLEDVTQQEVVRVEYEDGRTTSIYERFLEANPRMFTFYNKWDPGMISLKHGHRGDHIVFVLEGEVMVGDVLCRKGAHIYLQYGDAFGPWTAGPQGCELLGVIAGDSSAWWSDEDMKDYQDMLAAKGGRMGAVPALKTLPAWRPRGNPLPGPVYEPE